MKLDKDQSRQPTVRTVRSVSRSSKANFIAIVLIASIPAFLEGFDTSLFAFGSPFVLASIHQHNPALLGFVATGYALGIALFSIIGGRLFDKLSVKYTVMVAVGIFSIFTLLTGFVQNLTELFAFRLLVGIGIGLFQPAILTLLGDIFFETRGRAVSLFAVFFGGGLFFAPYIITPFLPHFEIPFIISSVMSVISLVLFQLIIPKSYKTTPKVKIGFKGVFQLNVIILSLSIFLFGIGLFGLETYFSDYLIHGLSLPKAKAASIASMQGLSGLLMAFPLGYLADRKGRKISVIIAAGLIMLGAIGIYGGISISLLFIATFLFGAGRGVYVALVAALGQDSVNDAIVGTTTGWLLLTFNIGAILGGPIFGLFLSQGGFILAGTVGIIIPTVLSFLATLFTKPVAKNNLITSSIH